LAASSIETNPLLAANASRAVEGISEDEFNKIEYLITQKGYSKEEAIQFILNRNENYEQVKIDFQIVNYIF
jgi:hypothetical protein